MGRYCLRGLARRNILGMDQDITDRDLINGIRRWSARLHVPMTRMMSRVLREEIQAARARRLAGEPEPVEDPAASKALARAILKG